MARSSSTTAAATMIDRVPIHWISTNPVMNVPKMLPAVEMAYVVPTMLPVLARSLSRSFTTMGVTMPRMTLGGKKSAVVSRTILGTMGSESSALDVTSIRGRMPRLETPLASSTSPRNGLRGKRSAATPPT